MSTLAGEWRVAGIDGKSLDEPVALSLTADEGQLWWSPRCAGLNRFYRIEGRQIAFTPTQVTVPGEAPPPVCQIGVPARVQQVFEALDRANSIARTDNNGVLVSGPTSSVLIFAQ